MYKYLVGAVAFSSFFALPASAAVIDQSNIANVPNGGSLIVDGVGTHIQVPNSNPAVFVDVTRAQSLTVGISGKLDAVDLQLTNFFQQQTPSHGVFFLAKNVTFNPDGSVATGTQIGSFDVSVAALAPLPLGGLVHFDASSLNLHFNAGEQLWLVLTGDANPSLFGWAFGTSPTFPASSQDLLSYAGGQGYVGVQPSGSPDPLQYRDSGHDYGFRTWVDAGAVPEPASWALMIAGFGLVGGAMRVRQRGASVSFA